MKENTKTYSKRQCTYSKSNKTLDTRHKEQTHMFEENKNNLESLNINIKSLQEQINKLELTPNSELSDDELKSIVHLKDELDLITEQRNDIHNSHKEIKYYTDISDILYDYYAILEQKNNNVLKNIHVIETPKNAPNNNYSILDLFKKDNQINNVDGNNNMKEATKNLDKEKMNDANKMYVTDHNNNRALLLDKYLYYTDKNYINNDIQNVDTDKCSYCNSYNKVYCTNDSLLYCRDCYTVEKILTDNEKPSYKDPPKEISYFSYKRINHYTELILDIVLKLLRTVGCS